MTDVMAMALDDIVFPGIIVDNKHQEGEEGAEEKRVAEEEAGKQATR